MFRKGYFYKDHHNTTLFNNPEFQNYKLDQNNKLSSALHCRSFSEVFQSKNNPSFINNQKIKGVRKTHYTFLKERKAQSNSATIQKLSQFYRIKNQETIKSYSVKYIKKSITNQQRFKSLNFKHLNSVVSKNRNQYATKDVQSSKSKNNQNLPQRSFFSQKQSIIQGVMKRAFIPACKTRKMPNKNK